MLSWERTTLGSICESTGGGIQTGPFGSQLHAGDYVEDGTPSVMPQNIGDNRIIENDISRISSDDIDRLSRYVLRTGDIVYSRRGDVERRAFVRPENDGWLCGTGCLRVRIGPHSRYSARFISYALGTAEARQWIRQHAVGATMLNLNTAILSAVPLTVPKFREQVAIAEVLTALEDKIAANDQVAAKSLEFARCIYRRAVEGAPRVPMSSVLTPLLGGTPQRSDDSLWDGTVPWASAKDITGAPHQIVVATSEGISESAAAKPRLRTLPAGSVVLTARGTVGAVARLAIAASINQSCYGFVPVAVPAGSLFFAVEDAAEQAKALVHGSVFDTITMRTFDHVVIPKLDPSEWARLEDAVGPTLSVAEQKLVESERLTVARDELLPLLMSGNVRVKEAEKVVEEVT